MKCVEYDMYIKNVYHLGFNTVVYKDVK